MLTMEKWVTIKTLKRLNPDIGTRELARLVGVSPIESVPAVTDDNLKAIIVQCIMDAADSVCDSGVQLNTDELQRLAVTLFITRSKAAYKKTAPVGADFYYYNQKWHTVQTAQRKLSFHVTQSKRFHHAFSIAHGA